MKSNRLLTLMYSFTLASLLLFASILTLTYNPTVHAAQNQLRVTRTPLVLTTTLVISKAMPQYNNQNNKQPPSTNPRRIIFNNAPLLQPQPLFLLSSSIITFEDFEDVWPAGLWYTQGNPTWGDTSMIPNSGNWSIWAARSGSLGVDPYFEDYPHNMRSWAIYGKMDFSNISDPRVHFWFWNKSEQDYDYFKWMASSNGTKFYGWETSGNSNGWQERIFDLTEVVTIGNLAGKPEVWVAFFFISDADINDIGPFVDDVTIYDAKWGKVYNPNPVATSGDLTLGDINDLDDPRLMLQRFDVKLTNLDDSGYLRGDYVDLVAEGISFPDCDTGKDRGLAYEPDTLLFNYTRSDDGFEEVNIYYHITTYHNYIDTLGYGDRLNRSIPVHAHCKKRDNSEASTYPALMFGEGGVDDAEDGEVIIHEYIHLMIFEKVGADDGTELEYKAIQEGLSDYLSSSFFADQAINSDFETCFGEWKAIGMTRTLPYSNPYCIRRLDTNKKYPQNMTGISHQDSEIFGGALWLIRDSLGQTITDKLVLQSLEDLRIDDGFGEAGDALIKADQFLNQGTNQASITDIFKNKGIFDKFEPNNNSAQATLIIPPVPLNSQTFYSENDVDWFAFEAGPFTEGGPTFYKIETAKLQVDTDTVITLYYTDSTTILLNNDNCNSGQLYSCLTWHPPTTGTYYLKVNQRNATIDNTGITYTYNISITTKILTNTVYIPVTLK